MPLIAEDFATTYNPDHQIKTIISLACDTSEGSLERLRKHLKQATVCIDVSNKDGETAVSILARQGNVRVVGILITEGAQRNWAVCGAARGGYTELVDRLLKEDASKDWAVHGAARGGYIESVDRLLKKGVSKDWAVGGAAQGGHTELVDRLLKQGASKDEAVGGAALGGHAELVDRLLKQGASKNWAVYGAARGGHIELVERLLKEATPKDWAVCGAARGGHTELVDRLLKEGASKDWAVYGAARGGHIELVERLLKEATSKDWAVCGAARGGHTELVDRLLKEGASKDWAVYGAAQGGDTELIDRLLKEGADIAQAAKIANLVVANWLVLNHQLLLSPKLTVLEKKTFLAKHFNSRYKFVELLVDLQERAHYANHLNLFASLRPLSADIDFGECIAVADRLYHLKLILGDRPFAELYKVASSIAGAGLESGLSALTGKNKLSKLPTDLQAHILTFALKSEYNSHSDGQQALLPAYSKEQRATGLLNEVANALSRLEPSKPPEAPKRRCVIL